jgi:hypothetical protein
MFLHGGPRGAQFHAAGAPGWPYLECEVLNFRSRSSFQDLRDAYLLLQKQNSLTAQLDKENLESIRDEELVKDIDWRANHLRTTYGYWDLASADMACQLSEGLAAGLIGPHSGLRPISRHVDKQVLSRHPFYREAQMVRSSFRCFHRGDGMRSVYIFPDDNTNTYQKPGYLLTLAPPIGVNYLDKNLSKYIRKPVGSLLHYDKASALAAVFKQFAETGTLTWGKKTVDWFLIFLITELCSTPHSMRDGHSGPDVAVAFQSIIRDLVRTPLFRWTRNIVG